MLSRLCDFELQGACCKKSQVVASGYVPAPCLVQNWTSGHRNAGGAAHVLGVIMCFTDKWEVLLLPQTAISSVSCLKALNNDPKMDFFPASLTN